MRPTITMSCGRGIADPDRRRSCASRLQECPLAERRAGAARRQPTQPPTIWPNRTSRSRRPPPSRCLFPHPNCDRTPPFSPRERERFSDKSPRSVQAGRRSAAPLDPSSRRKVAYSLSMQRASSCLPAPGTRRRAADKICDGLALAPGRRNNRNKALGALMVADSRLARRPGRAKRFRRGGLSRSSACLRLTWRDRCWQRRAASQPPV